MLGPNSLRLYWPMHSKSELIESVSGIWQSRKVLIVTRPRSRNLQQFKRQSPNRRSRTRKHKTRPNCSKSKRCRCNKNMEASLRNSRRIGKIKLELQQPSHKAKTVPQTCLHSWTTWSSSRSSRQATSMRHHSLKAVFIIKTWWAMECQCPLQTYRLPTKTCSWNTRSRKANQPGNLLICWIRTVPQDNSLPRLISQLDATLKLKKQINIQCLLTLRTL